MEISFENLSSLDFELLINPQYPLKDHSTESIKFINKELIPYSHVMRDGSICIHTSHCVKLEEKLRIDFNSLKDWIVKYYINAGSDTNYEHIIVNHAIIKDHLHSYIFAETNQKFEKSEFGTVELVNLGGSPCNGISNQNYLVRSFKNQHTEKICQWSKHYQHAKSTNYGYYLFVENTPAIYNRFVFENWTDFNGLFPDNFIQNLYNLSNTKKQKKETILPIFIGYKTVKEEIHWQVALLEFGKFPIKGIPIKSKGIKTGKWKGGLISQKINWALSENASYSYFFGRGAFSTYLTNKKILIIGVGAIGSIIAKTLARGGCKHIDIADYDVKKPENICRSEYFFNTGIGDKVLELEYILTSISPHCNVNIPNKEYFETIIKVLHNNKEAKEFFCHQLNQYDLILDCTTDNDLMYILNSFQLSCDLINISMTNYANELVCAFYPNIYKFVMNQFENVLLNNTDDLYNPTGCWSPTFRASYSDIDLLVQMALKHINNIFEGAVAKNNFIVTFSNNNLKIKEF